MHLSFDFLISTLFISFFIFFSFFFDLLGATFHFLGSTVTIESYASQDCLVLLDSAAFTLDACVATTPTSSTQSLGHKQWSYVKAIPSPKLTGYFAIIKWAEQNTCTASPINVVTYKLNDCNIGAEGEAFIFSITSTPFSSLPTKYDLTSYSDRTCTTKIGDSKSDVIGLFYCSLGVTQTVLNNAFQLTSVTPTLVLRYSY